MTDIKELVKIKILSNILITEEGCWIWKGSSRNGYGRLYVALLGGRINVHRLTAWIYRNTELKSSLDTLHKCNRPLCCNPEHTYEGTHLQNMQDRKASGNYPNPTHCIHGHEFTPENTYTNPVTGKRRCETCFRKSRNEYLQRQKLVRNLKKWISN